MIDWLLSFTDLQFKLKMSNEELKIVKNKYYYCYFRNLGIGLLIGIIICKMGWL